jgi:HSP20 family protein
MAKTEITKSPETAVSRPRDVFSAMRDEMDRMFERFDTGWPSAFRRAGGTGGGGSMVAVPELDVRENGQAFTIEAELPGVEEKDVDVTLANGLLTIKGEKKDEREEKGETYYRSERSFGSFERTLRLPDTIDDGRVEARFDKGVLTITAPKRPEAVKTERKIEIRKDA